MKKNTLKTIAIVLIILLISLISFVGIYQKKLNKMVNILPEYQVGMDFGERRVVRLDVDLGTETVYLDENGNEVEETDGENITSQEVLINKEEVRTEENYKKAKTIVRNRLQDIGTNEYQIRQDEDGNFAIELKEDDYVDTYIQAISSKGTFLIKDSQTSEVLLDNNNIKDAKIVTYQGSTGAVTAYLVITFDKDGKNKLEEISKIYVETTDEEGNTSTKNVLITLDDETMMNTYFGQTMSTGELQIPIGNATTSATQLSSYVQQGQIIASILKNGELPIEYEIGYNNTLSSAITTQNIQAIMIVTIIFIIFMLIYLVVYYKIKGLLAGASWIGFLACLLLVLRYTNCIISVNSIVAIVIVAIWEYIFLNAILHNKQGRSFKENMIHYAILGIPMYVIAIVFAFGTAITVNSFGIALFWGSMLMFAYNLLVTKNIIQEQ